MKNEPTWDEVIKKFLGRIGAYLIVYFTATTLVGLEIYTPQNIVLLMLSYIVVDVTLILIRIGDK